MCTMDRLPHLAQRLFNMPLAIRPDKTEIVMPRSPIGSESRGCFLVTG